MTIIHIPTLVAACLLAATTATAQARIEGVTRSVVGAFAESSPTSFAVKSLPVGHKLGPATSIRASSGTNFSEFASTISGSTAMARLAGSATGTLSPSFTGSARSFTDRATLRGAPQVRFTFRADRPTRGRIVVVLTTRADVVFRWRAFGTATAKVDRHLPVTADSLRTGGFTREFGVTLDKSGTNLDVTLNGFVWARTRLTYEMKVEAVFVPGHQVSSFGTSCGDLHSTFPNPKTVDLHVRTLLGRAPTFLIVGTKPVHVPLPGNCTLLVDPLAVVGGFTSGANGRTTIRQNLPSGAFDLLVQVASSGLGSRPDLFTNGLAFSIR